MQIQEKLNASIVGINAQENNGWLYVDAKYIFQAIAMLKSEFGFHQLIDMTAIDRGHNCELVYILRDINENKLIQVKAYTREEIQSISAIFPNAELYECEIYEMFGIRFSHHPNLRMLFTDDISRPMRKRYD